MENKVFSSQKYLFYSQNTTKWHKNRSEMERYINVAGSNKWDGAKQTQFFEDMFYIISFRKHMIDLFWNYAAMLLYKNNAQKRLK